MGIEPSWMGTPFGDVLFPALTRAERRRRMARRRMATILGVVAALLAVLAVLLIVPVAVYRYSNGRTQTAQAHELDSLAAGFPYDTRSRMLDEAREYNRGLASGEQEIGAAVDPFSGKAGDFSGSGDQAYMKALDVGNGAMGSITIPKIGVDLPIWHGSDTGVLSRGVGHLHGTSLPVGGPSTHAALTGHRGLADMELFTRLNELGIGDVFYIHVLGETLAYRVDDIRVVEPDQVDSLRVQPGRDLVTLVTCTPYGINTQRLLITGERAGMPYEDDVPRDAKRPAAMAAVLTFVLGSAAVRAGTASSKRPRARHARE